MSDIVPSARDAVEAARRLAAWLTPTPILESPTLNQRVGARVLVKAECLQPGGSFKIRGALNRLLCLGAAERGRGVVAFSSGNHAQGVALAARWLGMEAVVVMPRDAPAIKRRRTVELGAEVVLYDRDKEDRQRIALEIAEARGAALVPPFDHPDVIAGQGSLGVELAAALKARRLELGALYVPCSGGGLVAGCSLAVKVGFPECRIVAVEPEGHDDMALSLAAGRRRRAPSGAKTLCDALMAPMPGTIAFKLCCDAGVTATTVSDAEALAAMAVAAREFRLVLEPSGAVALAAALKHARGGFASGEKPIGVVLSGGNVDADIFARAVSEYID
jgi:threonine dehydratase